MYRALVLLEQQLEEVTKGTHFSLIRMHQELERRRKIQLERAEARYHAQVGDLERLRDQAKHQEKVTFRVRALSFI